MENEEDKKITIDDFAKIDIRIGKIISADFVENSDKLVHFIVDLGESAHRHILSGIREYYPEPSVLVGKFVPVVVNLSPRKIRGIESNGMILYALGKDGKFSAIEPSREITIGAIVR